MKKRIFCLAAALVLLCSCAAEKTDRSSPESKTDPSGQAAPDGLHILSAQSAAGYYLLENSGNGQMLCFIDYAQASEVPLCTSVSCAHDSESCTAWIPENAAVVSLVAVDGKGIAFIESPEAGAQRAEAANADGTDRRTLYTAAEGQYLETIACADEDSLYCVLGQMEEKAYSTLLCRIPLDGGEVEPVLSLGSAAPELKGVCGDALVLYQSRWGDTPEESEENGGDHRVFLLQLGTKEEQTLDAWHSEAGSNGRSLIWSGDRLYWIESGSADAICWMDSSGKTGKTAVSWPQEVAGAPQTSFTLEKVIGRKALITVWGPWGTDSLKRYAIDLAGETAVPAEIPLTFVSNASERPIEIMGQTEDDLLVHFAQQDAIITQVQEDGYPAHLIESTNRYGLISWEDFLAGIPNYREIQMA